MRPFRYALQAALDRAVESEREAGARLASATAALDHETARLDALDKRLGELCGELVTRGAQPASMFAVIDRSLVEITSRRGQHMEQIAARRTAVTQARAELARCARERSVFERHVDRLRADYDALVEQRENAALDEANLFGSRRADPTAASSGWSSIARRADGVFLRVLGREAR